MRLGNEPIAKPGPASLSYRQPGVRKAVDPEIARVAQKYERLFRWAAFVFLLLPQFYGRIGNLGRLSLVVGGIAAFIWLRCVWDCAALARRDPTSVRWIRTTLLAPILSMVVMSGFVTGWPLAMGFKISRPALNRLADEVGRGATTDMHWCGIYLIKGIEGTRDGVELHLAGASPESAAFVRPKVNGGGFPTINIGGGAGRRSFRSLDGGWFLVE